MHNIIIGTKREERLLVTTEVAISFLGSGRREGACHPANDPVHGVDLQEYWCCPVGRRLRYGRHARQRVAPGSGSHRVGGDVYLGDHRGSDRRVEFRVAARSDDELIGEGTHERGIINVAKFATRLAEKMQRK